MRYLALLMIAGLAACSNTPSCASEDEVLTVVRTTISDPQQHWCSLYTCVDSSLPTYGVVLRDKRGVDRFCYINKVTAESLQPNQRVSLPEALREF